MDKLPEKVLMVDDDRNLLDSFRRQFRKHLNLETATSGADGVQAVRDGGPFAVVISDMQMPNMNGVEFLSKVYSISPNTVRIMLTGNANLDVAVDAVNDGNIFRFLNKPVETDQLYQTITDGIQQYRLITSEKVLLNKTLKGAVDLLADILSMVNPVAFSQSSCIKQHAHTIVKSLSLDDSWHYDLAAMLCQLGYVSLTDELIEKVSKGSELSHAETTLYESHPVMGARLLKHIPRLEIVASMVERQNNDVAKIEFQGKLSTENKAILGGQIIRVAIACDRLINQGMDENQAIAQLKNNPQNYDPILVEALSLGSQNRKVEVLTLPVSKLVPGLILDQPINTEAGILLVAKGQVLSQAVLFRLMAAEESGIISGTFRVFKITQM
ncbi:MAG: response regulator [Candidatus Thiodiazotropha sp. (ex Lucinoma kastoroae)]|nr:response regulator [Candidatus Thiodiazotropha sp. (ex Lucinoma kastoroae)]MCU7858936.1 response regulator [Candidatus Thiodiazotropha sp. (ex Lucinoma kastoroae)]